MRAQVKVTVYRDDGAVLDERHTGHANNGADLEAAVAQIASDIADDFETWEEEEDEGE